MGTSMSVSDKVQHTLMHTSRMMTDNERKIFFFSINGSTRNYYDQLTIACHKICVSMFKAEIGRMKTVYER